MSQPRTIATLVLAGLLATGCDPSGNPDLVAIGVGGGSIIFTIIIILFSLVITIVSVAAPIIIIVVVMKNLAKKKEEHDKVLKTGKRATATVLSLSETGTYINNRPMVSIRLHVQPQDRPPFEAKAEQLLSQLEIPRVQPGMKVAVSIDPTYPDRVVIDLNAPVNVPAWCQYCQKSAPQGSHNCPHCGAPLPRS